MGIESLTQFTDVPAVRHTFPIDEPPVPYSPVVILGETDDIIAVNKPASLPVHPCGAYRYNSLETILRKENKLSEFYFIHRLDRVTSGVMLLAKRKEIASKLSEQLLKGGFHKVYLAVAEGNCFEKPELPGVSLIQQNGMAVNRNIAVVSQKEGVCKVDDKEGKVEISLSCDVACLHVSLPALLFRTEQYDADGMHSHHRSNPPNPITSQIHRTPYRRRRELQRCHPCSKVGSERAA